MVAMDMETIGVIDGEGIRNLTLKEGLVSFIVRNITFYPQIPTVYIIITTTLIFDGFPI